MVCFSPLAEQPRIVTSVCVLVLGNLRHYLPTAPVRRMWTKQHCTLAR
jgi:hypothetical protein